jgi:succinate-semialdehyde dehydrogenase / glutarate-semialdehyde dehydrogenase
MSVVTQNISSYLKDPKLFRQESYINGDWITGKSQFPINNPATGDLIANVCDADDQSGQQAIDAASAALSSWSKMTGKERSIIMRRWYDLMIENIVDLATIMTLEQGKPLEESKGEVLYGASFLEWFAEEAKRVTGSIPASTWPDKRIIVLKQAIGVCVAITPWNFPIAMITRKIAPAMAAGCTIVIKPAEQTPLSALALAELAHRAGVPKGVINILTASADQSIELGKIFCESADVKHISFTGSTEVGRILMRQGSPTIKKLALELGGHAPFIVFEDADIDAAVAGAMAAKYRNGGQTCISANRFYVHKNVCDIFVAKLMAATQKITVGNGLEQGISQGPVIDEQAIEKIERHIADAVSKGAKILTGGKRIGTQGTFFEPTILSNVDKSMVMTYEETFGPVAPIIPFENEDEIISLANHSEYGLASYFYSRDVGRVWRVAEALEYGIVGVNTGFISTEVAPFGGVKQSGLGREGSSWGIDEYLEMKYVCLGL